MGSSLLLPMRLLNRAVRHRLDRRGMAHAYLTRMTLSFPLSVAVVGLSLCLVHCNSSSTGGGPDASEEGNPPNDGATGDAPGAESSSVDAKPPADGTTADGNDSSATDAPGDGSADAATC